MRTLQSNVLKAIAFFVVFSFLFTSCKPGGDDPDLDDPTPGELVAPKVSLMAAENVTKSTATLVGWVTGNEKGSTAYFSYKTAADVNWATKKIGASFDTTDSVKVTFDLPLLQSDKEYSFKLTAENKAGKIESVVRTFTTLSNITATDYNGNTYKVVKIGNQYWMAENFKGTSFADGTAIANLTNNYDWAASTLPAFCWLKNDESQKNISGGLYNSYAYTSSKKLITGWHTPTESEIKQMIDYLGGAEAAFPKIMDTSDKYWFGVKSVSGIKPTNSSGFTAIPSGVRANEGIFSAGEVFLLASTTINLYDHYSSYGIPWFDITKIESVGNPKNWGITIRLVKD